MFCNDLKEKYEKRIIIKGVDAETMHTLLDYTYTSKALITKQNVQRVLEAANLFQVCEQIDFSSLSWGSSCSTDSHWAQCPDLSLDRNTHRELNLYLHENQAAL